MTELSQPGPAGGPGPAAGPIAAESIDELLGIPKSAGSRFFARWKRPLIAVLAVALLVGAGLLYNARTQRNGVQFVTAPVAKGDLHVVVTATGSVQPTNKVDISSELSGTVRRVLVDYNSVVKKGQALAALDTDKLTATVDSSRAKLGAAKAKTVEIEATIEEATREFERKKALVAREVSSSRDLDVAKAALDRARAQLSSARADVAAAEADLKVNETNLAKASIYSPIDGVVLKRSVDPGQTVASSLQAPVLFTIAEDLTKMEAQVDIDEADVGKVREGQSAVFTVDAYPDRKFPAKLRELRYAPETVQGVVTYKGILTVDNSELLLRPGMTATAEIDVLEVKDAILVPNAALRFQPPAEEPQAEASLLRRLTSFFPRMRPASRREDSGPERKLWVDDKGSARAVPVTVGATDGRHTEIRAGDIAPGQAVIVDTVTAKR